MIFRVHDPVATWRINARGHWVGGRYASPIQSSSTSVVALDARMQYVQYGTEGDSRGAVSSSEERTGSNLPLQVESFSVRAMALRRSLGSVSGQSLIERGRSKKKQRQHTT